MEKKVTEILEAPRASDRTEDLVGSEDRNLNNCANHARPQLVRKLQRYYRNHRFQSIDTTTVIVIATVITFSIVILL